MQYLTKIKLFVRFWRKGWVLKIVYTLYRCLLDCILKLFKSYTE